MTGREVKLVLPTTPPSFNAVGHSGSRWKWTKEKKRWQGDLETLLMAERLPRDRFTFAAASAVLIFPDKRRRDVVNYRTLLEKVLGDALVNGRWLPDDDPDHFIFAGVGFEAGDRKTTLSIVFR